jgi:hypothetical protein
LIFNFYLLILGAVFGVALNRKATLAASGAADFSGEN